MSFTQSFPLRCSSLALLAVLPWAVLGLSCSNGLQPVSGKVLLKGQPLKGAVVTLHPKGPPDIKALIPSGITGEDGTFTLSTGKEAGAAPGDYVATVVWLGQPPNAPKPKGTEPPPDPIDQLQGRYSDAAKSKLPITIKTGMSQLDPIKLD